MINFGFITGVLGLIFIGLFDNRNVDLYLLFIFESIRYFSKICFKKDALGKGDSKLVAMLGLWLGPFGILFAVSISYIFAAIYCLVGFSINLVRSGQVIPFAPFLSLGGLFIWFLGNEYIFEKVLRI